LMVRIKAKCLCWWLELRLSVYVDG
jgi:hypothetical protein